MRGHERSFQLQEREDNIQDHAADESGREAANDRGDDVDDPPKRAALVRPGLVNPTASMARRTTIMMVIGPPTLDFAPKMLTSNIPIAASSSETRLMIPA